MAQPLRSPFSHPGASSGPPPGPSQPSTVSTLGSEAPGGNPWYSASQSAGGSSVYPASGGIGGGMSGPLSHRGLGSTERGAAGEDLSFYGSGFARSGSMDQGMGGGGMGSMGPMGAVGGPEEEDFVDEPPLLEELGINPEHIFKRIKSVLLFQKLDHDLLVDCDMCGPLVIALALGFCLLFSGKIHFGYIYGLGITGCLGTYLLLNLMSQKEAIDVFRTASILGYGLLPVVGLAAISIIFSLRGTLGTILSPLCIIWCTATASRFFETALLMHHQRYLVAYPICLLYTCFVLITVF
mmetsp:Transcript_8435/g.20663  ORF Transcript_8435/g.20663 Transcript_8435/m.20663 type:complete len:296 (-) Transcript_8435:274-1161(-)